MKKILALLLMSCCAVASSNNVFSQLLTQQNVVINLSGNTPATSWVSNGTPLLVGYGENLPGNADVNLLMGSNTVNARGVYGMKRSRGTLAAPLKVVANDQMGSLLVSGFDGSAFQGAAAVDFFADGTPTTGNVPIRISFVTGSNGSNRAERLKIGSTGDVAINTDQLSVIKATGNVGIGGTTFNNGERLAISQNGQRLGIYPGFLDNVANNSWTTLDMPGVNSLRIWDNLSVSGNVGLGTTTPGGLLELGLDQGRKPATSTWTITSDARLKTIDGAYQKGLAEIVKLNPIAYHYKNVGARKFDESVLHTQAVGFAAQDVQKIFPEAVGTDADGYLNLNIHPILIAQINAFKEVKAELDARNKDIADLKNQLQQQQTQINLLLEKMGGTTARIVNQDERISANETASLEQNAPNPVNNVTVIKYHLPLSAKTSQLMITDAKGSVLRSFILQGKEGGQVTLSAGSLMAGTYFYTLLIDGRKVATKEMQIVK